MKLLLRLALLASLAGAFPLLALAEDADPPEVTIGERLFLETRFAQFFFARAQSNMNYRLPQGDPVVNTTMTLGAPLPGPFAGQSINCRSCHLVDEQNGTRGNRTYDDFARRSPIPAREDGKLLTVRNSPPLVRSFGPVNGHVLFHLDGEFSTGVELVRETLTGRNFGWLPKERSKAIAHIARVIRGDSGSGELAQDTAGLPYRKIFKGDEGGIPASLRLPEAFRIDVDKASDAEVVTAVARVIDAYDKSLLFARDKFNRFTASPFDLFLAKNGLPQINGQVRPGVREGDLAFSRRLRILVNGLTNPQFVTAKDGSFETHDGPFQFGPDELLGLKIFLAEPVKNPAGVLPPVRVGNCIACHALPSFSDFSFHNTGAAQEEYDTVHGRGTFAKIYIPDYYTRLRFFDFYLPATPRHPFAAGIFRDIPSIYAPGRTDLGVWNILGNPEYPNPQFRLHQLLGVAGADNSPTGLLRRAVARFKTPSLRDLGHAGPYFHTGSKISLTQVVQFYRNFSLQARQGTVRNPDPQMKRVMIGVDDVAPLTAFLQSLDEDYN